MEDIILFSFLTVSFFLFCFWSSCSSGVVLACDNQASSSCSTMNVLSPLLPATSSSSATATTTTRTTRTTY